MARVDNLENFLTDVASAIKQKTGVTSITPSNFDTAINNISTGSKVNGAEQQCYVGAGETIKEGDFITLRTGIASTENKATYFDQISTRLSNTEIRSLYLTDTTFVVIYTADDDLFLVIVDKMQDRSIERFTQLAATSVSHAGDMIRLSDTEFLIGWDTSARYCKLEGDSVFLGDVNELGAPFSGSGNGNMSSTMFASADNPAKNMIVVMDQETSDRQMIGMTDVYVADTAYSLKSPYVNTELACSNSATKTPLASYQNNTRTLQGLTLAGTSSVVLAYFSSTTVIDFDGTTAGTAGIYGKVIDRVNGFLSEWTLLISQNQSTARILKPLSDNNFFYIMVVNSDDSVGCYKVSVSGEAISIGSQTTLISIQPDSVSNVQCCPINSTQTIVYFPLNGYYYNNDPYSTPFGCSVVTINSSSIGAGAVIYTSNLPEKIGSRHSSMAKNQNGQVTLQCTNSNNHNIYCKTLAYTGNVITDIITTSELEEQAFKTEQNGICHGIAKTSGIGGSHLSHNDVITIYRPN